MSVLVGADTRLLVQGMTGKEGTFLICSFWLVSALAAIGEMEQATGLTINDFVEVNFLGFVKIINALGGVSRNIKAVYAGDANFAGSTSDPLTQNVNASQPVIVAISMFTAVVATLAGRGAGLDDAAPDLTFPDMASFAAAATDRNASSLAADGLRKPLILRTNWSAAARTSSSVHARMARSMSLSELGSKGLMVSSRGAYLLISGRGPGSTAAIFSRTSVQPSSTFLATTEW